MCVFVEINYMLLVFTTGAFLNIFRYVGIHPPILFVRVCGN